MDDTTTFEEHFSVNQLAEQWKMSRETVRKLVKDERDVVRVRLGRKKSNTTYLIPRSVAVRIHTRLTNSTKVAA
jgi:DNA-binding transcriptional regulator LsrR (DeoR family)